MAEINRNLIEMKLSGKWLYDHTEAISIRGEEYRGDVLNIIDQNKSYETTFTQQTFLDAVNPDWAGDDGFVKTKKYGWVKFYLW